MGTVHQLILDAGIDQARLLTTNKVERQCVDTAFAVMSDEQQRVGIMHAGFAMTALPHKEIQETKWVRDGGGVRLIIDSGTTRDLQPVGIPYGSIARMILLYLQTEAVKTRSRDIELGRNMNHWLSTMGIEAVGGKTYRLVREQSKRLSLCRLTFFREAGGAQMVSNGSFVRDAILPIDGDDGQMTLWRESVRLDEGFYQSLIDHPMPVSEAAIKEIGGRSMAIDVYVWLAYRLHQLGKPTPVSWAALFAQFGGGYQQIRQFRARFKEPLALALAAYPEAKVNVDDRGVTLHPSVSPVPSRHISGR
ncbi:pirin [alpha proteobacterium AAP38]|nr:pirin [alpha proteobacterium AAP38]